MSDEERWRPVLGFEDRYEVSDCGRVRATFASRNNYWKPGRMLRLFPHKGGYLRVQLNAPHGKRAQRLVHRLVLEAFVGPRPPGMEACHADDDPANNYASNLSWGTRQENMRQMKERGRCAVGSRNGQAKLTEDQVREIRRWAAMGMGPKQVGELFGLSPWRVTNIVARKEWAWLR